MRCVDRLLLAVPAALVSFGALAADTNVYHCLDKPSRRIEAFVGYAAGKPERLTAVAEVKARFEGSAERWRPETLALSDSLAGFPTTVVLTQSVDLTKSQPSAPTLQASVQFVVDRPAAETWFASGHRVTAELASNGGSTRGEVSAWPTQDDSAWTTPKQEFAIRLDDAVAVLGDARSVSLALTAEVANDGGQFARRTYRIDMPTLRRDLDTAELALNELLDQYRRGTCRLADENRGIGYYGRSPFLRMSDTELYEAQ